MKRYPLNIAEGTTLLIKFSFSLLLVYPKEKGAIMTTDNLKIDIGPALDLPSTFSSHQI
jgi:hypothetical protein